MADYNTAERRALAQRGRALKDLSFPVNNLSDLDDAIRSWGRVKPGKKATVKRFLSKMARVLNAPQEYRDRINNLKG